MSVKLKNQDTLTERDLGYCRLVLRADNVLVMYCDEDTTFDENHLKVVVKVTGEMTNGTKCGNLIIAGKYSSVTSEARDFIATDEAIKYTLAEVYVIQSLAQRILGNFYLKFYKPRVPTKIFTDIQKAEKWLSHQLKRMDSLSKTPVS